MFRFYVFLCVCVYVCVCVCVCANFLAIDLGRSVASQKLSRSKSDFTKQHFLLSDTSRMFDVLIEL